MNNSDHISESLETFFWVKILKLFDADPGSGIPIPDPQPCKKTHEKTLEIYSFSHIFVSLGDGVTLRRVTPSQSSDFAYSDGVTLFFILTKPNSVMQTSY